MARLPPHRPREKRTRFRPEEQGSTHARGYGRQWQRLRAALLASPGWQLCRLCDNQGEIREATLLDHIVPIRDGGAVLDPDNLQPLCRWCHDIKTNADLNKR